MKVSFYVSPEGDVLSTKEYPVGRPLLLLHSILKQAVPAEAVSEELAIHPEHVHLFVRVFPTTAAAEVVKEVKGLTSHDLREKHPTLLRLPSLWTRSYFAATAGNVSEATIRRYIEAQKGV